MLTIVADEQIAHLQHYFAALGNVIPLPPQHITAENVQQADILLVRTQTRVDAKLLVGSKIKFVGTATAGFDHLDTHWLQQNGITWSSAPGCNAGAVADYVLSCIHALHAESILPKKPLRVGIIGVGHVGQQVAAKLGALGHELLLNDPPRNMHTPVIDCDVICVHAALHNQAPYPSYHLINHEFLQQQKAGCVLINAARGEIVDGMALKQAEHIIFCADVWENEPLIDLELVQRAFIATPHIAGYTQRAKARATEMLYKAVCDEFAIDNNKPLITSAVPNNTSLQAYDVRCDSKKMKAALLHVNAAAIAETFLSLRANYSWRA